MTVNKSKNNNKTIYSFKQLNKRKMITTYAAIKLQNLAWDRHTQVAGLHPSLVSVNLIRRQFPELNYYCRVRNPLQLIKTIRE